MYHLKILTDSGQYVDASGVRCDVLSSPDVTFSEVHPEYAECDFIGDALTELGLEPWRSCYASGEWADKGKLIEAVRALAAPEQVAAVMADIPSVMDAVTCLTQLTTDAAPGNRVELTHPAVARFLELAGLTLDQVKAKMAEA